MARYIGVTVSEPRRHADLESFLKRERPDTTQVNYSITEREAEDRLIPLAADRGIAVIVNRPFMNGAYFKRLEGRPVPQWAERLVQTFRRYSLTDIATALEWPSTRGLVNSGYRKMATIRSAS